MESKEEVYTIVVLRKGFFSLFEKRPKIKDMVAESDLPKIRKKYQILKKIKSGTMTSFDMPEENGFVFEGYLRNSKRPTCDFFYCYGDIKTAKQLLSSRGYNKLRVIDIGKEN